MSVAPIRPGQSLAALAALIDTHPSAALLIEHPTQRIAHVNPTAERELGARREELVGRPCTSVLRSRECMRGCVYVDGHEPGGDDLVRCMPGGADAGVWRRSGRAVQDANGAVLAVVEYLERVTHVGRPEFATTEGFVARAPASVALVQLAHRIARSRAPVLISGPSGSGRSHMAHLVHAASPWAGGPLVTVQCPTIEDWPARFAEAEGGSLLIEDLELMPTETAVQLLQALSSGMTRTRVLVTAGADLPALVAEGRLDQRVYFRLKVLQLELEPLKTRPEDILPLAERFLSRCASPPGSGPLRIHAGAAALLLRYPWPGNARELDGAMQHAALLASDGVVTPACLPLDVARTRELGYSDRQPTASGGDERSRIRWALGRAGGNVGEAARALGMSRSTFWRRRRELGL